MAGQTQAWMGPVVRLVESAPAATGGLAGELSRRGTSQRAAAGTGCAAVRSLKEAGGHELAAAQVCYMDCVMKELVRA